MTSLELTAVGLTSVWLGGLTVLLLATIRQLAIVEASIRLAPSIMQSEPGLEIGSDVPLEVMNSLAEHNGGPAYLIFLSPNCPPCLNIVLELTDDSVKSALTAIITGDGRAADDLERMIPARISIVRGSPAATVANGLDVPVTPFAVQIENGVVTGKSRMSSVIDLQRFVDAYSRSDAAELARQRGNRAK